MVIFFTKMPVAGVLIRRIASPMNVAHLDNTARHSPVQQVR